MEQEYGRIFDRTRIEYWTGGHRRVLERSILDRRTENT
jgi:hypothetical protein